MEESSLFEPVRAVCGRLGPLGWTELLSRHGVRLDADDLQAELRRALTVDRSQPGFGDFAAEGVAAIEPGQPARSLLYHALASPLVRDVDSFPTPAEIEAVENYVFGVEPPSMDELRARAGGLPFALVVYAVEYRPGASTPHQRHADLCFSRTGVARIGTKDQEYLGRERGYASTFQESGREHRVIPCRYAAYLAVRRPGSADEARPMRHRGPDDKLQFWVPIHKVFSGPSCIRGRTIEVRFVAHHVNDKLRRAHLFFQRNGHDGGWAEPQISEAPFVLTEGIAELSSNPEDGAGLLVPVAHETLVEPATLDGAPVSFLVPQTTLQSKAWTVLSSSLNLIAEPYGGRSAPEYLHARSRVELDDTVTDLNTLPNLVDVVRKGGYRALHYIDRAGNGWVDVRCTELALDVPHRLPAYSLVASPDFFPKVKQSELMVWTDQSAPPGVAATIWPANPGRPQALSDQRLAADGRLNDCFDPTDTTMTALVGMDRSASGAQTITGADVDGRESTLPDGAAGVFAPGWDVGRDRTPETGDDAGDSYQPGVNFMAIYGLGSPFPEDMKLCAALSSFWPAVAPDINRAVEPFRSNASVTPLTDDVLGLSGGRSWDGVGGPVRVDEEGLEYDYPAFDYVDYVAVAMANGFDSTVIAETTKDEYLARTLTTARAFGILGATTTAQKARWSILSFRRADPADPDLLEACSTLGVEVSSEHTYRFEMAKASGDRYVAVGRKRVTFVKHALVFADPLRALTMDADGWVDDVVVD